ncbi:hypothetical protein [Spongiactinospora sp. TRM90649]|uniref:hypothetical protein n=1 Tax=Spongiactinospora sp. TRM90649 TaxID=3031114 RepID=UPI0023F85636|nr:hypothetical protein [Spongiactinospora sp. TRM90649]MDF5751946.1 hypothetical protein [Spongiactinospora sp. TRM90649]
MSATTEVRVEVWPISADQVGLWLISGQDAWRSDAIRQDSDPHSAVEALLEEHQTADVKLLHSTSWRADDTAVILTYVAVVGCSEELALDRWPRAVPISPELPDAVGKPIEVTATEAPFPRYIDVLMHGLRHLQFLLQTDSSAREALCDVWRGHLAGFRSALAGMYDHKHGESPIVLPDANVT